MSRLLLDLNVVLDVLLERRPHVEAAAALWSEIERGKAEGLLPAHGVTTVFYVAQKARGGKFAQQVIEDLLEVFGILAVDESVIRQALALSWPDFEDAVTAACALAGGCDAIVTRDPDGFPKVRLPVMDPIAAQAWLKAANEP